MTASTRANRAAAHRAAHATISAHQCAKAYINLLAVCCGPDERIEDQDLYAVQVAYCAVHDVDFAELYRGNDVDQAQRIIDAHNKVR